MVIDSDSLDARLSEARRTFGQLQAMFDHSESLLPSVQQHNVPNIFSVVRTSIQDAHGDTNLQRKEQSILLAEGALKEADLIFKTYAFNKPKERTELRPYFQELRKAVPHFLMSIDRRHPLFYKFENLQGRWARIDPHGIRGCMALLIHNAIVATRKREKNPLARVTVRAFIRNHEGHPHLYFQVSDRGPGISENLFGKLFLQAVEPTEPGHRGRGLEGVNRMVSEHGGFVFKKTRTGYGSTMGFAIPLERPFR